MAALHNDPYSFLPTLVRVQPTPGTLDLRFRCNSKDGSGEATLYAGERAVVRLIEGIEGELSLRGPNQPLEKAFSPEGRVHAHLCSRPENAVLDRESAFRFNSIAERESILSIVREPLRAAVNAYQDSGDKALPQPPRLGQEIDAIAVDPDGALAIIEVKPKAQTGSIGWTPAQVTFYARIFKHWIEQNGAAASKTLREMLNQRIELRLIPTVELHDPIRIKPVIALEHGLTNLSVAKERAEKLQEHLLQSGVGWKNLEARAIEPDGSMTDLQWFRK